MNSTKATLLVLLLALLSGDLLLADDGPEDLYDPAEAAKYRRKESSVVDSILNSAADTPTTQPATQPDESADTQPDSPFSATPQGRSDSRPGYLELSDGRILCGRIFTTRDKPWSVYDAQARVYRRIPPVVVGRIDAVIEWERLQQEWRFKEAGSDEKVLTGRSYPARKLNYAFRLINGMVITGTVQQPIYLLDDGHARRQFILHERQKGSMGQALADLLYVRAVHFGPDALERGRKLQPDRPNPPATQPEP